MKALLAILFLVILATSIGGIYFLFDALHKTDTYHVAPSGTIVPRATTNR